MGRKYLYIEVIGGDLYVWAADRKHRGYTNIDLEILDGECNLGLNRKTSGKSKFVLKTSELTKKENT